MSSYTVFVSTTTFDPLCGVLFFYFPVFFKPSVQNSTVLYSYTIHTILTLLCASPPLLPTFLSLEIAGQWIGFGGEVDQYLEAQGGAMGHPQVRR